MVSLWVRVNKDPQEMLYFANMSFHDCMVRGFPAKTSSEYDQIQDQVTLRAGTATFLEVFFHRADGRFSGMSGSSLSPLSLDGKS